MDCTHDGPDQVAAAYDGLCPLCLKAENERLREALKKIARPRLGGKEQQWIAQEALGDLKDKSE